MMLAGWVNENPKVTEWKQRLSKRSANTADGYASQLHTYWREFLSRKFKTLEDWVSSVKQDGKNDEYDVQTRWAREVEEFVQTYTSPRTGRPLSIQARGFTFWSVRSYLAFRLGDKALTDYQPIFADRTDIIAERDKSKDTQTATLDEVRKLVLAANTRDRAVILCSMWGLGVGEFLTFADQWYKYKEAIQSKTVPLKVMMTRPKTGVRFYTEFFDDAVDALAELLEQRKRELGRDLGENDRLLVTKDGPMTAQTIQFQIRYLAETTGVEARHSEADKGKSYRVRPHEIGRDMFATIAENKDIPKHIYDFCMGHQIDPLKYDKSPWTEEGETKIAAELNKIRPYLNLITGRGVVSEKTQSYADTAIEFVMISKGKMPEELWNKLAYFAMRTKEYAEAEANLKSELSKKFPHRAKATFQIAPQQVLRSMTAEQLRPAVVSMVKSFEAPTEQKTIQKPIPTEELQHYLDQGWRFASVINHTSVLVERPKEVK